ncbi:MAG: xanthine dehydrogenase family protein molybdopterin-binding subunit [Ignavibacteriales bacterium]|nr:xanthine dehydrogenase family protein molybdopterin-binding subunit [Ignavibacteriales bacterium]
MKNWRNDAYAKVTGKTKFTDDLKFANLLHAVPVYSDYVHAEILSINTAAAAQSDGVVRVITAKDIPGSNRHGQIVRDLRILADDRIRYNGDVVAIIVAETRDQAIRATALVKVDARELPSLLDPEKALEPDAPLIHEDLGTNVINTHKVRRGDVDAGFRDSDLILEQKFETQFVEHAYMETEASVCQQRPDGVMEVYGSMQHPFSTRRFVSRFLGVALSEVEVLGTPLGGGFGGKDDTAAIVCARTALASKLTGRPVKMMYKRIWSMRESYKRHPYRVYYKMGVSKNGIIRAVQTKIIADGGAYCSVTPWVTWRSTVQCCGPYVVDNVHCDTIGVYTNNVFTGAMRGFGSPQMNFVIEQMVEMAAEKLGMSPIEFRRRNMVRQGSVTITGQKLDNHAVAMEQVLDAVMKEIRYDEKIGQSSYGAVDKDEWYGIGLAMSYRGVSLGAEGVDLCAAIINVQADGSVILEVGVHENGQGSESAMMLLLAEELGIDVERIRYRRSSTSTIPDSGTTVASRGTIMGGGALKMAARELKAKIGAVIAPIVGGTPEQLRYEKNAIVGTSSSIAFDAAMAEMFNAKVFPHGFGIYQAPKVSWDDEHGRGDAYFTWVYGCQAIELTVNRTTGKVKLLNAVAAHDVGKAINPGMAEGQFFGGMAMGIGYALHEEVIMKDGRIVNTNFNTYRIPRSMDMPEMKAIIVENNDTTTPTGAKSLGEPTNELMAPAIANALYHATGERRFVLPMRVGKKEARGVE